MKILMGLSGGLDSTYAAWLLKRQGHEVIGAAVRMHGYTDLSGAARSAEEVGIPFLPLDAEADFAKRVIDPFCRLYGEAKTPNPCVLCNPGVKFHALCSYAETHGFDRVATGHYAAVDRQNGRYFIRTAADASRDQSYVLWGLSQKQLSLLLLPLGGLEKKKIREEAEALGFSAAHAPESREICFIPDNDHAAYIRARTGQTFPEGDFLDEEGHTVGRHKGIIHYTVGQRKGLGLAMNGQVFVSAIDPVRNTVTVTRGEGIFTRTARIRDMAFQKQPPGDGIVSCTVKIRYGAKPVAVTAEIRGEEAALTFAEPVRAVTPGQSAVFYEEGDLLMGGIFETNK